MLARLLCLLFGHKPHEVEAEARTSEGALLHRGPFYMMILRYPGPGEPDCRFEVCDRCGELCRAKVPKAPPARRFDLDVIE